MVFESVVVELLNKVLGAYFENLDTSQLKLGIWGGDVVLRDLLLKTSALDDLNVPFKVVVGKVGTLRMRIPWQSLYSAPTELTLEDLLLLLTPSYSVQYDPVAEEKAAQAAKEKELARLDEVRARERRRKEGDKGEEAGDSFAEKLAAQIIKNVQLRIQGIHIRYEDDVTKPGRPFAFGVVLKSLNVHTTDQDWKPKIITEVVESVNKMARLEGLAVYWNSKTQLLQRQSSERAGAGMIEELKRLVEKSGEGEELTYVLGPINSGAQVVMTPNPDRGKTPFSKPKFLVEVVMEELGLGMSNLQFQDIVELMEAIDYMSRAQHYRKHRPKEPPPKGKYREWWRFAYACIEEDVKRRRDNWDWLHMKTHRDLCKVYGDAYYKKLTTPRNLKPEVLQILAGCERGLDVFNITLVRKQVEMRVEREGKLKGEEEKEKKGGWFSGWGGGWFSGGEEVKEIQSGADIVKKFNDALTPEEKAKLFSAIDYSESALPLDYPDDYLEYKLNFRLDLLTFTVTDLTKRRAERILRLAVGRVETGIATRPVKNGLMVDVSLKSFEAEGLRERGEELPAKMISSKGAEDVKLLAVQFESNPLHGQASQRVWVEAQPIEVVYHGKTVVELAKCFALPPELQITRLQAAAMSTINEWKEQSAAGIQHLVETRGEIDLRVDLKAPYFLIPQGGLLTPSSSCLIIDLGALTIRSRPRVKHSASGDESHFEAMSKSAYDTMTIELREFQVLFALPGEEKEELVRSRHLVLEMHQSLIPDDPRFPKLQIQGNLPAFNIEFSDTRLTELVTLLVTLPLPKGQEGQQSQGQETDGGGGGGPPGSGLSTIAEDPSVSQSYAISKITYDKEKPKGAGDGKDIVECVELVMKFALESLTLRVTRLREGSRAPFVDFELKEIEAKVTNRTFSSSIDLAVGGLTMCALDTLRAVGQGPLHLLKTPMTEGIQRHLLKIHFNSISPNCPPSLCGEVRQLLKADVTCLDVVLHKEVLLSFISFGEGVVKALAAGEGEGRPSTTMSDTASICSDTSNDSQSSRSRSRRLSRQLHRLEASRKAVLKSRPNPAQVILQMTAKMESLTVELCCDKKNYVKAILSQLDLALLQRVQSTTVNMELKDLGVRNLDPASIYRHMFRVDSDKVVDIQVELFENGAKGKNEGNMEATDLAVKVETGRAKVFYIASQLNELLDFINNFSAAKEAVIDASFEAALAARENVEQAYSSATRVLLDVSLNAPVVFIPRNGRSVEGVLADLGKITVKNKFLKKDVSTSGRSRRFAVLDHMDICLSDMKVSRMLFDKEGQDVRSEVLLVDPVSFQLTFLRNLSLGWFHGVPDFELRGVVPSFVFQASSEDYDGLMNVLSDNILHVPAKEKDAQSVAPAPAPAPKKRTKRTSLSMATKSLATTIASVEKEQEEKAKEAPYTKMAVNLQLPQLRVIMYTRGSSVLEGATGVVARKREKAFADFEIVRILLDMKGGSEGNMDCPITIQDITLKDIRPGERKITNLVRKKGGGGGEGGEVVRFSFKTDPVGKQGATMKLQTTSLTVILCLDYLLQITDFFARPAEEAEKKIEGQQGQGQLPPPQGQVKPLLSDVEEVGEEAKEEEPFSAFFDFSETEVLLIESMESAHSNALLLHCEVTLRQQKLDRRTNTMGTIRNLTLSTCNFSASDEKGEGEGHGEEEGMAAVIQPMSVTLVMNQSQEVGTLIDVNISDIFVRMTAGTLELLLKILSTIKTAGEEGKEGGEGTDHSLLWGMKRNEERDFWFLNPNASVETGVDPLEGEEGATRLFNLALAEELRVKERLVLESGCVVFTFETGVGKGTKPMLLLEMDLDLQLWDWSGNARVAGRMKLEAAYYNPTFGLWEYLVEPVETRNHGRVAHQPWELLFEFSSRKGGGGGGEVMSPLTPLEEGEAAKPFTSLVLESTSILELTVSKTALDVIDVLRDDFQAASKRLVSEKKISTVAYCVENETGLEVKVVLKDGRRTTPSFSFHKGGVDWEEVVLKGGTKVDLELADAADMTKHGSSFLREQEGKEERILTLEIPEFGFRREIPVNRACKRYFPLKKEGTGGSHLGLICDIWVKDCSKIVTLRSVVQVQNSLDLDVDVYLKEEQGKVAKLVGGVKPGEKLNLPLLSTLNARGELFFAPKGFGVSTTPFSWRRALSEVELVANLECRSKTEHGERRFHVKVIGEAQQAFHETTSRKNLMSQCCYIYLEPPLVLNNLLPVSLGLNSSGGVVLAEKGRAVSVTGLKVELDGSCVLPLEIPEYNRRSWTCKVELGPSTPEISQWAFTSPSSDGASHPVLTLGLHREENEEEKEVVLHVYCPYWMLNRTGLSLLYKGDDKHYQNATLTEHPSDKEQPVLFSFPGRAFFSKKAANVRVKDSAQSLNSDWSGKFSLDTAGSGGCVSCRSPSQLFQIGVEIQLSSWGLTKYVVFTPKFYLVNQCGFPVSVREAEEGKGGGGTISVLPNACIPFWPKSCLHHLIALVEGAETKAFQYDAVRHTLLQLPGKWGGIHVDIHHSDQKTVVTFSEFRHGQAPVLLVNGTEDCPIQLAEEGEESGRGWILPPGTSQLFTWRNPLGSRLLTWGTLSEGMKTKDRLFGDGAGSLEGEGGRAFYWISFLDGTQRTLLFTPDPGLTQLLQAVKENEVATAEYVVMLSGIGLSLVDNERLRELLYLRIASSEISWEASKASKRKRFKPLAFEVSRSVEMAYQNYLNQKAIDGGGGVKSLISLDAGIEVDFATMMVTKPQEKLLRRVFQTGIWIHYKTFPNSTQLHAKINRLQVDNQLQDTVFRVVFAPVPPPKSVALTDVPKPFAEVSIMQRINAHSYVQQFKYFKILVQEFHVKLDGNFLNALMAMFSGTKKARQESLMAKFDSELEEACLALKEVLARQIVSQGQKNFYDYLHLSPLKMHVSFSMGGSAQLSNHFLNLVLASVGVTLTEIQDVVFKLSCLELQHTFLSGEELQSAVVAHYSSQAIKQLYVLVLGLDVLGNPFGLATGIASGVEAFFYEPIQGAIQGPGEFAEGLALGVKKLVGSTLGGAAGAVSKITGTLGKGIAALTMDDEFQRKRREGLHNRGDGAETLARSGKGLIMGFVDGATGFFTKPIRGAKEEGASGFFKGVGKGTVGLVARPAAGVVDFASGSFDAVKKCASSSVEVGRMRPPRCILPDSKLLPYVRHEAEGVQLLSEIEKGKFGKTDCYVAHALISPQFVLLLTNRRLMELKRDEMFGGWGIEWSHLWEDFAHPPELVERGLSFTLRNAPRRRLKVFGGGGGRRDFVVPIQSAEVCTWLLSKIEEAMRLETGLEFTDGVEATELSFTELS